MLQNPGGIVVEELGVELQTICQVMPVRPEESMCNFYHDFSIIYYGNKVTKRYIAIPDVMQ